MYIYINIVDKIGKKKIWIYKNTEYIAKKLAFC